MRVPRAVKPVIDDEFCCKAGELFESALGNLSIAIGAAAAWTQKERREGAHQI